MILLFFYVDILLELCDKFFKLKCRTVASLFAIANLAGWHIMSFYVAKKNANVSLRSNASHPLSLFLFPSFPRFSRLYASRALRKNAKERQVFPCTKRSWHDRLHETAVSFAYNDSFRDEKDSETKSDRHESDRHDQIFQRYSLLSLQSKLGNS